MVLNNVCHQEKLKKQGVSSFVIKMLKQSDYEKAIRLKVNAFSEETNNYQGYIPDSQKELAFMTEWVNDTSVQDYRILLGAYSGDLLLGFAGASYAELEDSRNGMELNYLFVDPEHRGKSISLLMLLRLVEEFKGKDKQDMVVYNYHCSPSNSYYTYLGGKLVKNFEVFNGDLTVDLFEFSLDALKSRLIEVMNGRK